MRYESISEISEKSFSFLNTWAEKSTTNWNILIVSGFILLFVGAILIWVYKRKMGKADERTNQIYLKSTFIMLGAIILCDLVFPKEYMWKIFFLFKYSLGFFASGIYLVYRYKKDFS